MHFRLCCTSRGSSSAITYPLRRVYFLGENSNFETVSAYSCMVARNMQRVWERERKTYRSKKRVLLLVIIDYTLWCILSKTELVLTVVKRKTNTNKNNRNKYWHNSHKAPFVSFACTVVPLCSYDEMAWNKAALNSVLLASFMLHEQVKKWTNKWTPNKETTPPAECTHSSFKS